jgi:uncharacterized protein
MDTKKYALITGSSQGLGRAIAEECAGRGMNLILVALPESGLPEVASIIRRVYEVEVEYREADLTERDSPASLVEWVRARAFRLTMLVNNAGTGYNRRFDQSTLHENETTIELNVLALVRLTHLLLPKLVDDGPAYVLNVGSLAAYFPMPFMPVYSPTKSFVVNFSLALREEMASNGLSVSVLCPNGIRTNKGCREQIDRQGLAGRLTCLYPDQVARAAVRGLLDGRPIIVPGIVNKIIRAVGSIVPRALVMRVVARHWGAPSPSCNRAASPLASRDACGLPGRRVRGLPRARRHAAAL